jgi:hypothetical protein
LVLLFETIEACGLPRTGGSYAIIMPAKNLEASYGTPGALTMPENISTLAMNSDVHLTGENLD